MAETSCPTCRRVLRFPDADAPDEAVCPLCATRFALADGAAVTAVICAEPPRQRLSMPVAADEGATVPTASVDDIDRALGEAAAGPAAMALLLAAGAVVVGACVNHRATAFADLAAHAKGNFDLLRSAYTGVAGGNLLAAVAALAGAWALSARRFFGLARLAAATALTAAAAAVLATALFLVYAANTPMMPPKVGYAMTSLMLSAMIDAVVVVALARAGWMATSAVNRPGLAAAFRD